MAYIARLSVATAGLQAADHCRGCLQEEREAQGMAAELFGGAGQAKGEKAATPTAKVALKCRFTAQARSTALIRCWCVEQPPTPKGSAAGGASAKLESTADFLSLAKDLGGKFKKSKAADVATFFTEVFAKGGKDPLGVEELEELIGRE